MDREKVFIVGGGPSLIGFNFNLIENQDTITVNYAVKHVPNPTYFLTADSGVIKKAADSDFWGLGPGTTKVVVINPEEHKNWPRVQHDVPKYDEWIKPWRTDTGEIGFTFDKFVTGKNTGFCALQYAVLLGYKKIYLLGFDLSRDSENRKYFYPSNSSSRSPYDVFFKHFVTGLRQIQTKSRIEVAICSRPSRLEAYLKFVPIEAAIK